MTAVVVDCSPEAPIAIVLGLHSVSEYSGRLSNKHQPEVAESSLFLIIETAIYSAVKQPHVAVYERIVLYYTATTTIG